MTTAESKWQTDSGKATSDWNNAEIAAAAAWTASEFEARTDWNFASDAAVNAWNLEETNAVDDYNADVDDANAEWQVTNDNAYAIYSSAYDNALGLWNSKEATASAALTSAITSSNATAIGAEVTAWNAYVNASNGQMLGARLMVNCATLLSLPKGEGNGKWREEKDPKSNEITQTEVRKRNTGWYHPNPNKYPNGKPVEFKPGPANKDARPDFEPHLPDAMDPKGKPVPVDPKDPKKGNIKPRIEIPFDTDKNGKVPTDKPIQRDEHDRKAEEEMGKLIPGWLKPPNSTWHHKGYNPKTGKGTIELVPTDIHKAVPHDGAYSDYTEDFEKKNPKKMSK